MSILTKTVIITLHSHIVKHYENLGYLIPRYYEDSHKTWRIKQGTQIEVKVSDLTENSNVKVLCKCDGCGLVRVKKYSRYVPLCRSCARNTEEFKKKRTGPNSPLWNFNKSEKERMIKRTHILGYRKSLRIAKERDKSCVLCHSTKHLQCHHINDFEHFPKLRCDPENIVTLCFEHHKGKFNSIHHRYGHFPTKKQWEEFKNDFFQLSS